jgi:hypothetical protein
MAVEQITTSDLPLSLIITFDSNFSGHLVSGKNNWFSCTAKLAHSTANTTAAGTKTKLLLPHGIHSIAAPKQYQLLITTVNRICTYATLIYLEKSMSSAERKIYQQPTAEVQHCWTWGGESFSIWRTLLKTVNHTSHFHDESLLKWDGFELPIVDVYIFKVSVKNEVKQHLSNSLFRNHEWKI